MPAGSAHIVSGGATTVVNATASQVRMVGSGRHRLPCQAAMPWHPYCSLLVGSLQEAPARCADPTPHSRPAPPPPCLQASGKLTVTHVVSHLDVIRLLAAHKDKLVRGVAGVRGKSWCGCRPPHGLVQCWLLAAIQHRALPPAHHLPCTALTLLPSPSLPLPGWHG